MIRHSCPAAPVARERVERRTTGHAVREFEVARWTGHPAHRELRSPKKLAVLGRDIGVAVRVVGGQTRGEQLRARGEAVWAAGRRAAPCVVIHAASKRKQGVARGRPARRVHAAAQARRPRDARSDLAGAHRLDCRHAPDEPVEHTHVLVWWVRHAKFVVTKDGGNRWEVVDVAVISVES